MGGSVARICALGNYYESYICGGKIIYFVRREKEKK